MIREILAHYFGEKIVALATTFLLSFAMVIGLLLGSATGFPFQTFASQQVTTDILSPTVTQASIVTASPSPTTTAPSAPAACTTQKTEPDNKGSFSVQITLNSKDSGVVIAVLGEYASISDTKGFLNDQVIQNGAIEISISDGHDSDTGKGGVNYTDTLIISVQNGVEKLLHLSSDGSYNQNLLGLLGDAKQMGLKLQTAFVIPEPACSPFPNAGQDLFVTIYPPVTHQ